MPSSPVGFDRGETTTALAPSPWLVEHRGGQRIAVGSIVFIDVETYSTAWRDQLGLSKVTRFFFILRDVRQQACPPQQIQCLAEHARGNPSSLSPCVPFLSKAATASRGFEVGEQELGLYHVCVGDRINLVRDMLMSSFSSAQDVDDGVNLADLPRMVPRPSPACAFARPAMSTKPNCVGRSW